MLRLLEYRGYDSAGGAVVGAGDIETVKAAGKLSVLEGQLSPYRDLKETAIGHTRRATHDGPTTPSARPPARLAAFSRIHVVACGTAYHAGGVVAKRFFESLLRCSTEVSVASEFRYGDPLVGTDTRCASWSVKDDLHAAT